MTNAIVQDLSAFTVYECSVRANTSAGEGGPSNIDTAMTDEDGEFACA